MQNPPRSPRRWRWLRRGLVGLVALVTLMALVLAEENWRGKRAWENYRREWEAKGEKFDLKDFVPPPVPDEQNFAMTPFFAPLFDFNPRPLQPGQSQWRDTNGQARAFNFASDLPSPKRASGSWTKSQGMDLSLWALAFQGKTNEAQVAGMELPRAEAAAIVLQALEKYKPVLDEIQAAGRRPYARFNIRYEEEIPAGILLPHLAIVKKMAAVLQLRASAELALGRTDAALADTLLVLRLSDALRNEPFLISGLVRIALLQMALQPVWEGLAAHQWPDAQLGELENELGKCDLLAEYSTAIRGERALGNGHINYLRGHAKDPDVLEGGGNAARFMPGGLLYQNELTMNRLHQEINLPPVDVAKHRIYPQMADKLADSIDQKLSSGFKPYTIFARLLFPAVAKAQLKFAAAQSNVEEATLACALERSRLANGQHPETLDALAPRFIKAVPQDIISGEPLKYRRNSDGSFLLYSVGWNEKDDGGKVAMTSSKSPSIDLHQGDWVWPLYPAK